MISGHMAEAQQGFAVLKEVDEATFVRFARWAYAGYYTSAEHEVEPNDDHKKPTPDEKMNSTEVPPDEIGGQNLVPVEEEGLLDTYADTYAMTNSEIGASNSSLMQASRQDLKESFIERKCTTRLKTNTMPPPRANTNLTENYTAVFLCHARLYVFAEQYDIQPLKILALEELQLTLASYTLYPERTGDIIALLRYIYANTGEPVAGVEDLRTLVTAYMSYEMDTLMKDKAFKEVMFEDGGALLGDFMNVVEKRI